MNNAKGIYSINNISQMQEKLKISLKLNNKKENGFNQTKKTEK